MPFLESHGTLGKLEVKSKVGGCSGNHGWGFGPVPCGAMTVIGVSTLLRKWRKYNKGVDYGQFILIV